MGLANSHSHYWLVALKLRNWDQRPWASVPVWVLIDVSLCDAVANVSAWISQAEVFLPSLFFLLVVSAQQHSWE